MNLNLQLELWIYDIPKNRWHLIPQTNALSGRSDITCESLDDKFYLIAGWVEEIKSDVNDINMLGTNKIRYL